MKQTDELVIYFSVSDEVKQTDEPVSPIYPHNELGIEQTDWFR